MAILRVEKTERYSIIANDCFADNRLSYRAVGLLCYLLSKPNDWKVRTEELTSAHREGRDATKAALDELRQCGYVAMDKGFGAVDYIVRERPEAADAGRVVASTPPKTEPRSAAARATAAMPSDLLRFIVAYPPHRSGGNGSDLQAAWAAATAEATAEQLFAALERHKGSWKWTNEPKYVPGVVKWLAEGRWKVDPEPAPHAPPTAPGHLHPPDGKNSMIWGADY